MLRLEKVWLSYESENTVAAELYHSFGFSETGEMDGEELIAKLKLNKRINIWEELFSQE